MTLLCRSFSASAFTIVLSVLLGGWQATLAQPIVNQIVECQDVLLIDQDSAAFGDISENEVDVWCLDHPGGPLWVRAQSPGSIDVWLSLYDEGGTLISANDDAHEGTRDAVLYADTLPGTYRVVVRMYSRDMGEYIIEAFTSDHNFDVEEGDCGITLAGQGWHASGGTGGLVRGALDKPTSIRSPVRLPPGFSPINYGAVPTVAIIVVDDFGGIAPTELAGPSAASQGNLSDISHGMLVEHHVQQAVQETVAYTELSDIETKIRIETLDIGGYAAITRKAQADVIAARLQDKIDVLIGQGISHIVVNMSFSIIPCESIEALTDVLLPDGSFPTPSYEEYVLDVQRDLSAVHMTLENATASVTINPLLKLFRLIINDNVVAYPGLDNIVFVAAAGNLGNELGVALYPGAWPEVIGVAALDEYWDIAPYSSLGEVALPGGWYRYAQTDYYYSGTSFAAPTLSVYAALWLQQLPPACPFEYIPPQMARPITAPARTADVPHFDMVRNSCPP